MADDDETIRRRSSWLIPLAVLVVVCSLSALILFFYLAPPAPGQFRNRIAPTSRDDLRNITVSGHIFHIPSNYLPYSHDRRDGERNEVALFALLPELSGWSNWEADAFASNAAESRVVFLVLRKDRTGLDEASKLKRVYFDYVAERTGREGPYELRQYTFQAGTGYRDEDLLAGETEKGLVLLRCVRPSPQVPSPNCLREMRLAPGLALSYRFKRSHLAQWREIASKVDKLIAGFAQQQ